MKKLLAGILVMAMGAALLTGCGGADESTSGGQSVEADGNSANAGNNTENGNSSTEAVESTEKLLAPTVQVTTGDGTSYETDNVAVTMSAINRNDPRSSITHGGEVTFTIKNKNATKISFNMDCGWINGYTVGSYWTGYYWEIEPGETVEKTVELPLLMLEQIGITNVGELKFQYWVRNRETGIYLENVILGYQTADYGSMDTKQDVKYTEIGGFEDIKVSVAYIEDGSFLKDALLFEVENAGDRCITVTYSDLTAGKEGEDFAFWTTDVVPEGSKGIFYASLIHKSSGELFKKGDNLKMHLRVTDYYTGEMLADDVELTYTVK